MPDLDMLRAHLQNGRLEAAYQATLAAAATTRRARKVDPHWLAFSAMTRNDLGHNEAAVQLAERAVAQAPADPLVRSASGLAHASVGVLDRAWADVELARHGAPEDPLPVVLLAGLLDEHEQRSEALDLLSTAIARNHFDNDLRLARANVLTNTEPQRALSDVEVVLARSPEHVPAMILHALITIQDAASLSLLNRAVELAPHSASALAGRAMCRIGLDPESAARAREDATAAREMSGDSGESLVVSGLIDCMTGDLPSARVRLESLRTVPSIIAGGWTVYATAAFHRDEEADARDAVDRALTAKPTNVDALGLRGILRFLADDHEGARRDARDALGQDGKNVMGLSVEAGLAFVRGDLEAAARRGNDALNEDPAAPLPLLTVGWAAAESGDFVTARRRVDDLRKLGITDEANSIERRINELNSVGRRKRGAFTTVLERASLLKSAIDLVKMFTG